ncbi:MAG: hypothetical protein JJD92_10250 [Frankiaceae bacterium]|nr:hypothetical protein [Frankiaceae bacterium]
MCSNPSLQSEVDALAAVDVTGLSMEGLQRLVTDVVGGMTRLGGVMSRAVGEIQVRGGGSVPDTGGMTAPTPAWLRSVTKTTGTTAGRQIRTSVALRELPLVSDAIVTGDLTEEAPTRP